MQIPYTLVRRRRKSVGIAVSAKKGVVVSAPSWVSLRVIGEILEEKREWILAKQREIEEAQALVRSKTLDEGELYLYRGREYPLRLIPGEWGRKSRVEFDGITLAVFYPSDESSPGCCIARLLRSFYMKEAERVLCERVDYFSHIMGIRPSGLSLRDQKTRWGSCSSKGRISFNWRLILASPEVLDYVVVHEMTHLFEMNHSKRFWDRVEKVFPGFRHSRDWIKKNGASLRMDLSG